MTALSPVTLLAAAVLRDAVARHDWDWFRSEVGLTWCAVAGLEPDWVSSRVARLSAENRKVRRVDLAIALRRPTAPALGVA